MNWKARMAVAGGLVVGLAASGLLGAINLLEFQGVWLLSAAMLAAGGASAPEGLYRAVLRLDPRVAPGLAALVAGGATPMLVLCGMGAYAVAAGRVSPEWADRVWALSFPTLPLFASCIGWGLFVRLRVREWVESES